MNAMLKLKMSLIRKAKFVFDKKVQSVDSEEKRNAKSDVMEVDAGESSQAKAKPEEMEVDVIENCVICLEDMALKDSILLPCKHQFHRGCIFDWAIENKFKPKCPVCRYKISIALLKSYGMRIVKKTVASHTITFGNVPPAEIENYFARTHN